MNKKFFVVVLIIVVTGNVMFLFRNLVLFNGKVMQDVIGINGNYKYAYALGLKEYGLYRKGLDEKKYYQISERAPLTKSAVFFDNEEVYYSTRAYNLVRLNSKTLEEEYFEYEDKSLILIGMTEKIMICQDVDNDSVVFINISDMTIYDEIANFIAKEIVIDDSYFEFTDYKSKLRFRYSYENKLLEEINEH